MNSKCPNQIFNEPLAKDITSSSEDPASCFVVRARRRLRTRLKRKSCSFPRKDDSSSSTSIADTESCPTEELDEEEVIHIEMDDGSKELLLKDGKARKRSSRVGRILAALTKISWLGKRTVRNKITPSRVPSILFLISNFCADIVYGEFSFPFRRPIATASAERGSLLSWIE